MRTMRPGALFVLALALITFTPIMAGGAEKAGFGVITPLSGGAAHYGTNFWRGIWIAGRIVLQEGSEKLRDNPEVRAAYLGG